MMETIFKIVTPSFNQGEYIEDTIKSVFSQSGDFRIEYIIADGGSSDKTLDIIRKYEKAHIRNEIKINCRGIKFEWWSKPDKGQANAINRGLERGRGNIYTWINSDDYLHPEALENVRLAWEKNPDIDFLYGDAILYFEKNKEERIEKLEHFGYEKLLREGNLIHQPASFFSCRLHQSLGGLDESLHYTMDYDMILRALNKYKYLYLPKTLAVFRVQDKAKTQEYNLEMQKEMQIVRQRYGGKKNDPSYLHYIRSRIPGAKMIKKNFPNLFSAGKALAYKFVNLINRKS